MLTQLQPLYQKTISLNNPATNWTQIALTGSENYSNVRILDAFFSSTGYKGSLPWWVEYNNYGSILIFRNQSDTTWSIWISMVDGGLGTVQNVTLTIQYTKTTD